MIFQHNHGVDICMCFVGLNMRKRWGIIFCSTRDLALHSCIDWRQVASRALGSWHVCAKRKIAAWVGEEYMA